MTRAVDVVRKVAPKAKASYIAAFESGDALLQEHDITTPDRLAHFLAQVLHESGGLRCERENLNYSAERLLEIFGTGRHSAGITFVEAHQLARDERAIAERVYGLGNPRKAQTLGNTQPGDGFRYCGRGLLQTTGRANYRRMGQQCGVDFENKPELIVSAEHALKPALAMWTEKRLNVFADNGDIRTISCVINLGDPRSKHTPNGMPDRAMWCYRLHSLIDRVEFKTAGPVPRPFDAIPKHPPGGNGAAASTIATRVGNNIYRIGDRGQVVRAIQLALAKVGHNLRGTGYFQEATYAAVRSFQELHGLEVDGEVGLETASALETALSAIEEAEARRSRRGGAAVPASNIAELVGDDIYCMGDEGAVVRAIQLALARLRYQLKGSGYYGGATETAVTSFQELHSLEVDGEVGPETAQALDKALSGDSPQKPEQQTNLRRAGDDRPLWLLEGLKWINTEEAAVGDNPQILDWAREEGGQIAKYYKHDSIPWCALYANMVLTRTGFDGTGTLRALDWENWGTKLTGPTVGAFAPMKRQGGGHIAIVVGRDQRGNLMCVGGNQDDAVNIKPFPASRPLSFRWPEGVPLPAKIGLDTLPLVKSDGRVSTQES